MKNAKIMVYAPGGQLLGDNVTVPEIGPSFANECIPIQMNLNNLGVPVTEAWMIAICQSKNLLIISKV